MALQAARVVAGGLARNRMLVVMPKAGSRAPGTAVEFLAAKAAKGTLVVDGTHVVVDVASQCHAGCRGKFRAAH